MIIQIDRRLRLNSFDSLSSACAFEGQFQRHIIATTDDVEAALAAADAAIVDVRTLDEYIGRQSGYDYLIAAGRIPTAIHCDVAPLKSLLDRADDVAIARWTNAIRPNSIIYCGGGWRSSVAAFACACAGVPIRNYSDGFCNWSTVYERDDAAVVSTPGWRQVLTSRPILRD